MSLTNPAFADSWASDMQKDPPFHAYAYKTFAPKTQTTYKEFQTLTVPVEKVVQQGQKLELYGNCVGAATGVAAMFLPPANPYVATGVRIGVGVGGTMVIIGKSTQVTFEQFKQGSVIKHKVYFKWVNPQSLEYATKVESWVEYKGKVVSQKKSYEARKTLQ